MPTIVVSTIMPGGGGDFTTLAAWELARRGDITAGGTDTIEIAEVYPGGDVGPVIFQAANWTTDFTNYIVIRNAVGNELDGDFANTATNPYASAGGNDYVIEVDEQTASPINIEIHGIYLDGGTLTGGQIGIHSSPGGGAVNSSWLVNKCMCRGTSESNIRMFDLNGQGSIRSAVVTNCFLVNDAVSSGANIRITGTFGKTVVVSAINNTCVVRGVGSANFQTNLSGAQLYTRNNYAANLFDSKNFRVYGGNPNGSILNGAPKQVVPSDITNLPTMLGDFVVGPETATQLNKFYDTSNFTNVSDGTENFNLQITSVLFDNALADDLTGPFTNIESRPASTNWVTTVLDDTFTVGNTRDVFAEDISGRTRLAPRDIGAMELLLLNPDFTADVTAGIGRLTVQFTDTTPNGPATTYDWDFGDGNTSTDQNPLHTYEEPGTYTVTLLIDDGLPGENTETKVDFISVVPYTVDFSADETTVPQFQDVTFTNLTNGSPVTFDWDFGDGQTSNDENPVIQYASVGTFTVTLTVDLGLPSEETLVKTDFVTVTDGVPPFTVASPSGGRFIDAVVIDLTAFTDETQTTEES